MLVPPITCVPSWWVPSVDGPAHWTMPPLIVRSWTPPWTLMPSPFLTPVTTMRPIVPVQPARSFTASPLPLLLTVSRVMFTALEQDQLPLTLTVPVVRAVDAPNDSLVAAV